MLLDHPDRSLCPSRTWRASHRAQSPTMRGSLDEEAFHGTHPHRRRIPPGPMGADGAPGAPPTSNRIQMLPEQACFFGGLCPTGRQERERAASQAFSPDVHPRRSHGGQCPFRLGLPERFRAHGAQAVQVPCPAARRSSSRPTFAASPIPLDSRLRLIYASHATPACAVHYTGTPAE